MVLPVGAFTGRLMLFERTLYFIPTKKILHAGGRASGRAHGEGGAGDGSASGSWLDVDDDLGSNDGGGGGGSGGGRSEWPQQEKWTVRRIQGAYLRRYRLCDTAVELFFESTGSGSHLRSVCGVADLNRTPTQAQPNLQPNLQSTSTSSPPPPYHHHLPLHHHHPQPQSQVRIFRLWLQ